MKQQKEHHLGLWPIRSLFMAIFTAATYFLQPFDFSPSLSLGLGAFLAAFIMLIEINIRESSIKTIIGAAIGVTLGIVGATLISLIIDNMSFIKDNTLTFLQVLTLAVMSYIGMLVGIKKGEMLNLDLSGLFSDRNEMPSAKILDTSVIIDGRVSDLIGTGFLAGEILVPEFVLRELQLVADAPDSAKRNRGRRGLDILQKIQSNTAIDVKIIEKDYPHVAEVDLKLIELAKELGAKIVTNDFNLNKVAQLRGVEVLNINELANVLKPVVLPGETMNVFVIKEGKESNQGVAYLDDGTMVVVDNASHKIGEAIDAEVTSVLQTTAGKMIFGRYNSKVHEKQGGRDKLRVTHP